MSPVIGKPPTRLQPQTSSSSSGNRMAKKRTSEDVVTKLSNLSTMTTNESGNKKLSVISEAVDVAHRILTPDPLFRDNFRPPLDRNNSEGVR
jgi:hypothetical protein